MNIDALKLMLAREATLRKFRIVQIPGSLLADVAIRAERNQNGGKLKKKPGRNKKGGGE